MRALELTLESALSPGGMVGHLAYFLLVISMLMRSILWLRIFVIASALVAITYAGIWLKDPVSTFWETMLVTVNVIQILLIWRSNRRARFTEEEQTLVSERLRNLSRHEARKLLDMGLWVEAAPGTRLTDEGHPVPYLVYFATGGAEIEVGGRIVARCGPGNFVGEMSLVDNSPASATATVNAPSRYWMIPTDRLRKLRAEGSSLSAALEAGIAQDLKGKILAANARPAAG
ncbi:MAG: cyclic nucleotide-binding domain-containing protein [Rhodobacteraceae bacterium]|nr:MAG: cyclic nucleotide-binding domain-containing protein [Paracoccaceae bacterium]